MKVVNLSLDPHLLDAESVAAVRARLYGKITDEYRIIVPTPSTLEVPIADTVTAYGSGGLHKIERFIRIFMLLRRLIREGKVDVITTQDPYFLGLLGWYFAKRYHLGLEIQILGIEKLSWLRTHIAHFVFRRASIVRALSKRLYERLHTEFQVPYERLLIVPIYVDVKKIGLDVRTLGPAEQKAFDARAAAFQADYGDSVNFLTVSRLVSIKNITLQLQAVERLVKAHPNIRLHIVGDGPERDALEKEIRNRGVEENVIVHGAQYGHDLGVFYLEADCFLLTSFYEGWGMVIIEAATAGLPVIMTAVGCADEVIVDGEAGFVIAPNDLEALVASMERIIIDPSLRSTLSVGALRALDTLPDLQTVLDLYKQSWERAADTRL